MPALLARGQRSKMTMLRLASGISIRRVARLCERAPITISRIERREVRPGAELARRLEAIYGFPIDDLLADAASEEPG